MSQKVLNVLEGVRSAQSALPAGIDDAALIQMYRLLRATRILDERAMKLQRQGRIGFYVPSTGQEACGVGSAWALGDADWCFPSYREQSAALTLGAAIQDIVNQWYGNARDLTKGRQMPVHYSFRKQRCFSISSPIGTQIVQAAGAAMAMKIQKSRAVALTYFGDGATSSNDFHSGMNFAAVYGAPCVFVCSNNQWAISCPLERQTASATIADKALGYGMPGIRVDGNDVLAVYQATREAVDRARAGKGPSLIEALTFRVGPHSSSDDPTRYRPNELVAEWRAKDPVERVQRLLRDRGLLSEKEAALVDAELEREILAAVKQAEDNPPPGTATLFEDVYGEMPPHLREQMAAALELERTAGQSEADADAAFPL